MVFPFLIGKEMVIHHFLALRKTPICACADVHVLYVVLV